MKVQFTVKTKAKNYWATVDTKDLRFSGNTATADLPAGAHTLVWWALGAPGTDVEITSTASDFKAIKAAITKNGRGSGHRHFTV